jgi:hypothetical protein
MRIIRKSKRESAVQIVVSRIYEERRGREEREANDALILLACT